MQVISQLATEADVHLDVDSFQVINTVGAVTLGATMNCEQFAHDHSSEVHYDRSSFVGMVTRPPPSPSPPPLHYSPHLACTHFALFVDMEATANACLRRSLQYWSSEYTRREKTQRSSHWLFGDCV